MKRYYYLVLAVCVAAFTFVSCDDNESSGGWGEDVKEYVITQFANEPFLGETYISDYDYEAGNNFLIERYKEKPSGACSSFRRGNFAARNLDWFVRDYAVLVVHTAANKEKNRYASVGIVSSNPFISRELIASGVVSDEVTKGETTVKGWRNIFPIFTTDGINEKGLCVNTNIVMHEDGVRENYVPCTGVEGKAKTSFVSLPRYILDNCASCEDAIEKCGKLNLTQAFSGALAAEDSHIFVSDMTQSVILEWYNNKMVVTKFPRSNKFRDEHNMPAIMTNFYNCIGTKYTDKNGVIDLEKMLAEHPYAMGVERYETIRAGYDKVTSAASAKELIKQVNYSEYYKIESKWLTENGFACKPYGGAWYYPSHYPAKKEDYVKANTLIEAIQKMYEPGGYMTECIAAYGDIDQQMKALDSGIESEDNWYTELTSIFDIKNKVLHIMPQEGWYNNKFYQFTVFGHK